MSKQKILIVEDEAVTAEDIKQKLKTSGYKIIGIANSYDKVLDIIDTNIPDVILMDIKIKGEKNGIETAHYIHRHFDIPIIYYAVDMWSPEIQLHPQRTIREADPRVTCILHLAIFSFFDIWDVYPAISVNIMAASFLSTVEDISKLTHTACSKSIPTVSYFTDSRLTIRDVF